MLTNNIKISRLYRGKSWVQITIANSLHPYFFYLNL